MWIVIDGPEKAGKSTLAQELVARAGDDGYAAKYVHFSGTDPVTAAHYDQLADMLDEYSLVVWDRSWASGEVYESLGFAQKPEAVKAEGEELFAGLQPVKLMLLGPSAEVLQSKRTPDDLPVPAATERKAFADYAKAHGWSTATADHDWASLNDLVEALIAAGFSLEQGA